MFKTMPDDTYRERLKSRLYHLDKLINCKMLRDFEVWMVLKNDDGIVVGTFTMDSNKPSSLFQPILQNSYDRGLKKIVLNFRRKHAGASGIVGEVPFNVMQICSLYDYREVMESSIVRCVETCNKAFYKN